MFDKERAKKHKKEKKKNSEHLWKSFDFTVEKLSSLYSICYTFIFIYMLDFLHISFFLATKNPICDLDPAASCGEKSTDTYHESSILWSFFSHNLRLIHKKTNKPSHEY